MIETLIDIGLAAGREIMAIYGDPPFCAESKADGSPVTQADSRAEAVILDRLAAAFPDISVVAEEEAAAGRIPAAAGRFFLVDPLDGTREFIARNGEFTVNIALVEQGCPTVGMIHAPALGRVFAGSARPNEPSFAWRADVDRDGAGPLRPIATRPAPKRLAATGSRSHADPKTDDWLSRFDIEGFSSCGSSLKFCAVACGEADIYPRFGRTMEWDTAAGDAILRAAGGMTATMDGKPLIYGKRDQTHDTDFANPAFVAVGDRSIRRTDGERLLIA